MIWGNKLRIIDKNLRISRKNNRFEHIIGLSILNGKLLARIH